MAGPGKGAGPPGRNPFNASIPPFNTIHQQRAFSSNGNDTFSALHAGR